MKYKKINGFTLIEILIVITILGIVLSIAYPLYNDSLVNNRLLLESRQTIGLFSFARAEAMRRGESISICASNDKSNACSTSQNINQGIIVFQNKDNQIIKVSDKWISNDNGSMSTSIITFNGAGSATTKGNILVCNAQYNSFTIEITNIGKIQLKSNTGRQEC